MDSFIIAAYRVVLRVFVVLAVFLAIVGGLLNPFGGVFAALIAGIITFLFATLIVGNFLTVLAIRDGVDEQNRKMSELLESVRGTSGQR
jgi:hypothetical protein